MTKEFFGGTIKIDTSSMTIEELIENRNEYQKIADVLSHEITMRKICEHKHKK